MPREISDPPTEEDKVWLKARNLPIPGEEQDLGTPQVLQRPDEPADAGDDTSDDYGDWKVTTLQKELRNRGLPVSGNKDELVARLQEDDDNEE